MKSKKFSTKLAELNSFKIKTWFWGIILLLSAWFYYLEFYTLLPAFGLALVITLEVIGMFFIGYFVLSKQLKFPRIKFWLFAFGFTLLRYGIVYFVLQHSLPEWTVFHYPERSILFLFFTSASFIFLGYSYSIYEWGLAARQEYKTNLTTTSSAVAHPIMIRCEGKLIHLLPQDIIYLHANGEYINYITTSGNYMSFQRMKVAEKELDGYGFKRVHRSFIINPFHIMASAQTEIKMKNEMKIPVSKTYRKNVMTIVS